MDVKLVALFLYLVTIQGFVRGQEPNCFSTFDYQEKLLEKMVTLTHSVHTMEKQLEKKFEELGKASDKVTEDQQALDAKFAKLEGSLKDETKQSFDKMKEKQGKALDHNSKKIDEMLKDTDAKVVRMSEDFYKTNASLTQMIKEDQRALDAKFAELKGSLKDETKHGLDKMKEKQGKALDDNSKEIDELLKDTDAKVGRMSEDFYKTNASLTQKIKEDQRALDAKFAKLEGSLKDETKHGLDKMKEKQDRTLDDNSKKIDEMVKDTDAKVVRMWEVFYKTNASLTQMIKDSIRHNVAFLAKDVSNISPVQNAQLVYTTALLNTDNYYSTNTGVFIAPVGGTYWFSTQICFPNRKAVNIRIYVNDIMMNDASYYDNDASTCSSSNTVALLTKGDRVYVKTGPNTYSGNVIRQGAYYWNTFMGFFVN